MSTLPKFQEPDWSKLPKEAVAWAVDDDGCAWSFKRVPALCFNGTVWHNGNPIRGSSQFDLDGIDWRTTLRLRPVEPAKVEPKPDPHVLADHLPQDEHAELCRRTELEFIAQEFMKVLLANPNSGGDSGEEVAREAFDFAERFIAERKNRRIQCP